MARSRTPVPSSRPTRRPQRRDPVADALDGVAKVIGSLERKVTKLMEKQNEHNVVVIERLKKLETVWKKANKSLGGLTEVLKTTHQLISELREHAGNDIFALKREIARVEAEVEQKIERLKAAGTKEKVRG